MEEKLYGEAKDWLDDLNEDQKAAIERAKDQLDAGKGIPHEKVLEMLNKCLN